VRIAGVRVGTIDAATLRRSIGYVFQGIGLFPHMRVGENIGITPQLLGWAGHGDLRRASRSFWIWSDCRAAMSAVSDARPAGRPSA